MVLRNLITPIVRNVAVHSKKGLLSAQNGRHASSYESHGPQTTMDDLPIPSGSWQTQYNANQTKYNLHLALGVGMTIVTLIVVKTSGLVYMNYYPPAKPAARE